MNKLYFGDNLEILRSKAIPDESVDLIYLDPPFNSQAQYNVLFKSPRDEAVSAQAGAFIDTWTWGEEADLSYDEIMQLGGGTAKFITALRAALGESDMMAYLVMMAVRLEALRSKLKATGTLYLHCDPTASHYLKVLLDGVFGADRFTNEIIWKRTTPKGLAFSRFATNHDVLLAYRRSAKATWIPQYLPYSEEYLTRYSLIDEKSGRRYQATSLLNPAKERPNLTYEFHGHTRVWRWTKERMRQAEADGRIYLPPSGGVPREKRFLDEQEGVPVSSVWTDIPAVNAMAEERIGYPTQKPLALLDRIIAASSNPGDVVLDPFCGCGTTIELAQRARRHWIGIDIAIHATKVIAARVGEEAVGKYRLEGIPRDFESALRLAQANKYQFQWWANYLFNPHAFREQKKGADRGIDGELFFPNGPGRPWGRMLTSVKGGEHVGPQMVREFAGVLDTEKAEMGLFICLRRPTAEMQMAAIRAGQARTVHGPIPRLQIVAIEEWFRGILPKLPPLEHLPSAAFSTPKRRPSLSMRIANPDQKEMQFAFSGGKGVKSSRDGLLTLNPTMVRASVG